MTSLASVDRAASPSTAGSALRILIGAAVESCSEKLHLPVEYFDFGSLRAIQSADHFSRRTPYCQLVWQELRDRCQADHRAIAEQAIGDTAIGDTASGLCHAGLEITAVPVNWGERRVGSLVCAQVSPSSRRNEAKQKYALTVRTVRHEVRTPLQREFSLVMMRGDRRTVEDRLCSLASWIGDAYRIVSTAYGEENLRPGAFDDPWSMLVHELGNVVNAVTPESTELLMMIKDLQRKGQPVNQTLLALAEAHVAHMDMFEMVAANFDQEQALGSATNRKRVGLWEVFDKALRVFQARAEERSVQIDLAGRGEVEVYVQGSRPHLEAAALNLVGNAVKYSYRGTDAAKRWIRVSIAEKGSWAEIVVANYGVGVLPSEKEVIYTKFFRGELAQLESRTGSGLGLYLVRSVVRAHHGYIDCSSEPQSDDMYGGPHLVKFTVRLPKG